MRDPIQASQDLELCLTNMRKELLQNSEQLKFQKQLAKNNSERM